METARKFAVLFRRMFGIAVGQQRGEDHQRTAEKRVGSNGLAKQEITQHHRKQNAGIIIDADFGSWCHPVSVGQCDLPKTTKGTH